MKREKKREKKRECEERENVKRPIELSSLSEIFRRRLQLNTIHNWCPTASLERKGRGEEGKEKIRKRRKEKNFIKILSTEENSIPFVKIDPSA